MENQKIINLLDKIDTDSKHFATKKWYIINDENNTNYGVNKDTGADAPDTIKYDTRVLKPNLCDYAEAYILVDSTIRVANALNTTRLALKNCAPFTKCNLEINDEHVDTAENLDIVMPMYNLIEYSDNYQDSSATLYQYKRDEPPEANAIDDLTADNSSSFKYKIKLLGNVTEVVGDAAGVIRLNVKVVVPLKYLSFIDGRNFYDNLIESDIEKYRELKKVMIGKGEDYTTGSLLDFDYFKNHYKLVAADLSKQKELDADPRAIQQIEFKYMLGTNSTIYWVLEKSKETILEFYKGTVKVY